MPDDADGTRTLRSSATRASTGRSSKPWPSRLTNPSAARGLWERIDRQTVDQAPWVPLVNPKVVDVLSKRVGNYQYSLGGGMLIDQLWVR